MATGVDRGFADGSFARAWRRSRTQGGRSTAFCSSRRWPPFPAQSGPCGSDLEAHTFCVLQIGNDLKQITGGRIPVRAKHLVKGLYVNLRMRSQLWKANRGIDVVTQELFAECHLAREKALDSFAKKPFSESGVAFYAGLNGFSKISRQTHIHYSSFCCFFLCL